MKLSNLRTVSTWLFVVLTLAAVNLVAGRLCLWFAIEPGYATAVFPPAGIALAAILLFGYRVAPGVFLGALAIGVSRSVTPTENLPVSVGIACGSTLQAILGAALIRRRVGFSTSLDGERPIAKFFGLGGPVACLTAATWGTIVLWIAGDVTSDLSYTWFTWWIGDSIGVMIFTPLVFIPFAHPREVWRSRWLTVGLPVTVVFGLVVGVWYYAKTNAETERHYTFSRHTAVVHGAISSEIESFLEIVHSIAGLYHGSEFVSRSEFRLFVERTLTRQPGVTALVWVPRVVDADRATYVEDAHADALKEEHAEMSDSLANYQIKRWQYGSEADGGHRWVPFGEDRSDEYFPVHYIEPYHLNDNHRALGIDLASNPERRLALQAARDTDQPAITAPVRLAQETRDAAAVLLVVPVHISGQSRGTVIQRRANLHGFASAVVRIDNLIDSACDPKELELVELRIVDESQSKVKPMLLYGDLPANIDAEDRQGRSRLEYSTSLVVGGRTWRIEMVPSKKFLNSPRAHYMWGELVMGLLFTATVGGTMLLVSGRKRQVERLVIERTDELTLVRFALDNAADSVLWANDDGCFFDVNRTACEKLGYAHDELIGMFVWDIDPEVTRESLSQMLDHLREVGHAVFESSHRAKDGTVYPVEISMGYIEFRGKGYHCAIARDISDRKEADKRLKSEQDFLRRMLDFQERERRTVAHEIHDGFVQYAVGAQMQVEALLPVDDEHAPTVSDVSPSIISKALQMLKKAIDEGRNMISDLRPMVIDESGVIHAIEHLLADESNRGLRVSFHHDIRFNRLDSMLEGAIFRIVQEALNNVKHHSRVDCAEVHLTQLNGELQLVVRDDGVGFDLHDVEPSRFGIRGIVERSALFGGRATVESNPGQGTTVTVQLPVTLHDHSDGRDS